MKRLILSLPFLATLILAASWAHGQPAPKDKEMPSKAMTTDNDRPRIPDEIGGKTLKQWKAELKDPDPSVRDNAVKIMCFFGELARKEAGPDLIHILNNDRDAGVKTDAAITLGVIGLEEKDMAKGVEALGKMAQWDGQGVGKLRAIGTLAVLGPKASKAIPNLISALKDQSTWEIREKAAQALGTTAMNKDAANFQVLSALIHAAATDLCVPVRLEALNSLLNLIYAPLKPGEKEALVPQLQPIINHKDKSISIWGRMVLMQLEKKPIEKDLKFIVDMMDGKQDMAVRRNAFRAMSFLGKEAKAEVSKIARYLEDTNPEVVMLAMETLVQMGDAADVRGVTDALTALAKDHKEELIRAGAKQALELIRGQISRKPEPKDVPPVPPKDVPKGK